MKTIKEQIEHDLAVALEQLGYDKGFATLSTSSVPNIDYQCNSSFQISKKVGKKPLDVAQEVASILKSKVASVTVTQPGFLNFRIEDKALIQMWQDVAKLGKPILAKQKTKTVFFDYGGANVAKELHIGHLRAPIVGEALRRVFMAFGHKTIGDTHLGDWGTHMGLIIAELELEAPNGIIDEKVVTLALLNEIYPRASKRKDTDEAFLKRAQEIVVYLQKKTEPYFSIWQKIKEVSIPAIRKNYLRLGCTFDTYEGDNAEYSEEMLAQLKAGSTYIDGGCLLMDVKQEGEHIPVTDEKGQVNYKNPMPPVMLQKSDGGVLYLTGDMATVYKRQKEYNPDAYVYVVDVRQSLHFVQLFRAARKGGLVGDNVDFTHVGIGTIMGKDGRPFRTRAGGVVKLEDIMDMVVDKAKERLQESGKPYHEDTAEKIGLAALKFADLSSHTTREYIFDLDKFTSFDGKTGPYLLYTVARINSILEKVTGGRCQVSNYKVDETVREILVAILKLADSFTSATQNYTLNGIADAVFGLAQSFNLFYANTNISKETDKDKQAMDLELCRLVKLCIEFALNTLAIEVVEKM